MGPIRAAAWLLAPLALLAPACRTAEPPAEPQGEGWIELFDGLTLEGWTEHGGRYDGDAEWTVEDGAIAGRVGPGGEGGLLYTEGTFDDFELELEVALDWPFDSGIFLRMLPPSSGQKGAQVTIDHRPGGEIAAIYSDGFLRHDERATALFREGEWNHFRVLCEGEDLHLVVWLNGEEVVDFRLPEQSEGYARSGRIGLQVHGDRDDPPGNVVRFKGVRVRPLARSEGAR